MENGSGRSANSVIVRPLDATARLGRRLAVARVDARIGSAETATAGPGAELLHRLRRRDRDRHDMLGGLMQGDIQQRRKPAARANLRAGPRSVVRTGLLIGDAEFGAIHGPDKITLGRRGNVEEKDCVEAFGACELWWKSRDIVCGPDEEHVGFMLGQPRQQRAEEPSGHAAVTLAADAGKTLIELIAEQN